MRSAPASRSDLTGGRPGSPSRGGRAGRFSSRPDVAARGVGLETPRLERGPHLRADWRPAPPTLRRRSCPRPAARAAELRRTTGRRRRSRCRWPRSRPRATPTVAVPLCGARGLAPSDRASSGTRRQPGVRPSSGRTRRRIPAPPRAGSRPVSAPRMSPVSRGLAPCRAQESGRGRRGAGPRVEWREPGGNSPVPPRSSRRSSLRRG